MRALRCLSCAIVLLLSFSLQAQGQPQDSSRALKKVTFSYSAVSLSWLPVKVAAEKGFFREEGLEPQLVQMRGNVVTTALGSQNIDFSVNISPVLNGAIQGLGLKLVAVLSTRPLFSLVVRPEIKTTADLKGKVFAVNAFGNSQAILTEKHLQYLGLAKEDYKLIAMGGTAARIAAMEKNLAQGSLMPAPANVFLESQGYRLLGNTAEVVANPIGGLGTHEDKIRRQPDVIKGAIRAALKGLRFVQSRREETMKVIMNWVRVSERDAGRVYDLSKVGYSKNGFVSDEELSIEWEFVRRETKRINIPVSVARDFTLLAEVRRELGFK
ncbi:MAG: ABC transporter substrate-binding protein [Deltaproteobacteria bacterium]|nr:ABC transporter substrate-binding protein [Deltaproteobacteria bacterium]